MVRDPISVGEARGASSERPPQAMVAFGGNLVPALGVLLVAVWRGAGAFADARPSRWFLGVLWALVAALVMTGYRGGQNVYRYGVGVTRAATAAGPPSRESTP